MAFRENTDDIDAYTASPKLPPKDASAAASGGAKPTSKWQPLSAVEPSPMAENDPFSLGDSDDEKEARAAKSGTTGGETKLEESERLRKAAAEAMADSIVDEGGAAKAEKQA